MADDNQAEPRPCLEPGARHSRPWLEQVHKQVWVDTDACIFYSQFRVCLCIDEFDGNPAALRCELDGICQKVPNDLLQPVRISMEYMDGRIKTCLDLDALGFALGPNCVNGAMNYRF
jgi:hypothetical protein